MKTVLLVTLCAIALPMRAANPIGTALSCGKEGITGGLGSGTDLTRYTVNTAEFPEAVCNDGTPAVFYYGSYTKNEDRNNWIIFLQGGGSCLNGQSCAERWCSVNTNYGMDKMSSSLSKASIRGAGFLNPDAQNRFGSWNRVLIYYCSSDAWGGTATRTLQATSNGVTRDYDIQFKGRRIVDAVLDTLRYAHSSTHRRAARHTATDDAAPWPDLDAASAVMFAGSSGGGAGVRSNLDHVAEKLRSANATVDVRGVIDAIYGGLQENDDFSKTIYCEQDPAGCHYDTYTQLKRTTSDIGLYAMAGDETCVAWHAAHLPGTEWRCSDGEHVNLNHIATPFFIRQDLQDTDIGGDYVDAKFGSPIDYAKQVESELRNLQVPEEARGATPGLFVPQCTDHESFTNNERVFDVKINGLSFHDTVYNWWMHTQPQQAIRSFTGTAGKAPECP